GGHAVQHVGGRAAAVVAGGGFLRRAWLTVLFGFVDVVFGRRPKAGPNLEVDEFVLDFREGAIERANLGQVTRLQILQIEFQGVQFVLALAQLRLERENLRGVSAGQDGLEGDRYRDGRRRHDVPL